MGREEGYCGQHSSVPATWEGEEIGREGSRVGGTNDRSVVL